ncbi:hypothetical protein STENM36S_07610 [Streptomyces tendae]
MKPELVATDNASYSDMVFGLLLNVVVLRDPHALALEEDDDGGGQE